MTTEQGAGAVTCVMIVIGILGLVVAGCLLAEGWRKFTAYQVKRNAVRRQRRADVRLAQSRCCPAHGIDFDAPDLGGPR